MEIIDKKIPLVTNEMEVLEVLRPSFVKPACFLAIVFIQISFLVETQ